VRLGVIAARVHTRYNRRVNIAKPIKESDLAALEASGFWNNVAKGGPDECWPWIGTVSDKGYGKHFSGGGEHRAHRVAFALGKNTALPGVVMVCHRCDNRVCANPNHLFIGLADDNNKDARAKGRAVTPRGLSNGNGKLSDAQVWEVVASSESGAAISRRLGVSQALVSMIRSRKRRAVVGTAGVEPATFRV
jgi:hypothetical protein